MILPANISSLYDTIKMRRQNLSSEDLTPLFSQLADNCLDALSNIEIIQLTSRIANKNYFSWRSPTNRQNLSRPINMALFPNCNIARDFKNVFFTALQNNSLSDLTAEQITKGCYVAAITFCAMIDLFKVGDQKTPGTFFEYLIGHLYARKLGLNPRDRVQVLNLDEHTSLPTDFVFDLGVNRPKFHLPVKTSTRERVIQVWAHQRVLDGVYGTGRFWGTLVALAETKLGIANHNVTEICLPDQWKLYQLFIAQMKRIYYLDLPSRYAELNNSFPKIHVKEFGEFFHEIDDFSNF